jgi:hypothetical protein
MVRVETEHEQLAQSMGALRERLSACRAAVSAGGDGPDALASALVAHLSTLRASELPPAAQRLWLERIVRPLKADPEKPVPLRALSSIRSWPSARVAETIAALAEIEVHVIDAENDAVHEVIYAEISRTYS